MPKLDAYFRAMHQQSASDLHLVAGNLPVMRIHGELKKLKAEPLTDQGLRELLRELASPRPGAPLKKPATWTSRTSSRGWPASGPTTSVKSTGRQPSSA